MIRNTSEKVAARVEQCVAAAELGLRQALENLDALPVLKGEKARASMENVQRFLFSMSHEFNALSRKLETKGFCCYERKE